MGYYKNKLKEKLEIISKNKGKSIPILDDNIFVNITEGNYRIVWDYNLDKIIRLDKLLDEITISKGKYLCKYPNGNYITLYSSEYINFSLKENREFKLNKILNIKQNHYIC